MKQGGSFSRMPESSYETAKFEGVSIPSLKSPKNCQALTDIYSSGLEKKFAEFFPVAFTALSR